MSGVPSQHYTLHIFEIKYSKMPDEPSEVAAGKSHNYGQAFSASTSRCSLRHLSEGDETDNDSDSCDDFDFQDWCKRMKRTQGKIDFSNGLASPANSSQALKINKLSRDISVQHPSWASSSIQSFTQPEKVDMKQEMSNFEDRDAESNYRIMKIKQELMRGLEDSDAEADDEIGDIEQQQISYAEKIINLEEEIDGANKVNDKTENMEQRTDDRGSVSDAEINNKIENIELQQRSDVEEKMSYAEKVNETELRYLVGDLLWAKVGCHPFWPCMVSYDPLEGIYTKKKKVGKRECRIYHVQYFGKRVQHGWTSNSIMPFEGENKFKAFRTAILKGAPSALNKKKLEKMYRVLPSSQKLWDIAVKEAEFALSVGAKERYENFVFKYESDYKKPGTIGNASKKGKSSKSSIKPIKRPTVASEIEELCSICQKEAINLRCEGTCLRVYHKKCLGILCDPKDFKCRDCEKGHIICFVCKEGGTSVPTRKCCKCDYYYHDYCIANYPPADWDKSICSLHSCLTCYNENSGNKKTKVQLVRCFRCPTVFHDTEDCTPVGSVRLNPSLIHCPDHYLGKQMESQQSLLHFPYCMHCTKGDEVLCCETCPASYHRYCIKHEVPAGEYYCEDCLKKRHFYVGMVIWAKRGFYRFWPAYIVSMKNLPLNIINLERVNGEFPVQYYGTNEYAWTHRGRVLPYYECHKDFECKSGSKLVDRQFKLGLQQAAIAFDEYVSKRRMQKLNEKPAYKPIKVNHAVPPAIIPVADIREYHTCECNPKGPNPCSKDTCINRQMLMECHPNLCPAGTVCENQKFQRRQYAQVKVFKTEDHRGWGLKANEFIPKGAFIIEYVGEIITREEYKRRITKMREENIPNYYFLHIDSQRMIDAGPKGNLSRFINHSCDPNCKMEKWSVKGDSRIGIFAVEDILPGTELTFNYQYDTSKDAVEQKCRCGSPFCRGIIGKVNDKPGGKNGEKSAAKSGDKSARKGAQKQKKKKR